MRRALWILAIVLLAVAALCFLLGIWLVDNRWFSTAAVFLVPAVVLVYVGWLLAIDARR